MPRTHEERIRAQITRTVVEWERAEHCFRELLLGLGSEMDGLERRVRQLEARLPEADRPAPKAPT
jgi:BMFP domain-containing protein YqiC